ncbi:CoA transferase [Pseudooceanicola sp. CBS1P-1]|uniref:Acyl-CoA transferase n=1 Tax=Pseudooceanicola albus TaxID=2692189 RepID=A0A6L7G3W5_9RHOB|nr:MULTISPECIES: CoA transferase [Pseudooceanicola]MBT9385139.1 CoA transferase [Pseudooceanicola endophyticus]MXN18569.1 acyl-CoA transferase [Pseudooceanicola albus]
MSQTIDTQIRDALGSALTPEVTIGLHPAAPLRACFAVSELILASLGAAARECAALSGAREVLIDQRQAQLWFAMTLRPRGWDLPSAWDPVAGDYRTADGWIRLHTNAPHHRAAALRVLDCAPERLRVAEAVAGWTGDMLETAILAAGGAAAAMRDLKAWADHPQGRAVAAEPLIAWELSGEAPREARLPGLRVLDLTRVLAGPVATRFLAGYGADVLRLDPPGWQEPGVEPEVTLGKRRAGLDLHRADDRQRFEALLAEADVLVHGYRPGALDRLGYGAPERRRLAPGLIDVSLDAYGWSGPWAGRRGFDSLLQMSTGIAAEGMRRRGADRPVPLPVQALDHATGYLMAAAVLRVLRRRGATGEILSARLSLARTAALLISAGTRDPQGIPPEPLPRDFAPQTEATGWGPAHRIRFPLRIPGQPVRWRHPAGPLRSDPARWTPRP